MLDRPEHRPVLAGKAALQGPGIRLEPLPEGHLLHVMGAIDAEGLAGRFQATELEASTIRSTGYRQWFIAGDDPLPPSRLAALSSTLQGSAFVSDQSHGRVRIGLSGPQAAELLARGTAVDLHPSAFPEGRSAVTLFGHISLQLTRTGVDSFELTVLRSFAEALYEELEALVTSLGALRVLNGLS
ncbi:sarcosine oxidase subunit gamma [Agrobacterium sp. SHOUNA12C]|uniref:Sarcosine oxidase gamma subunit n=1 Tax=Rhizobium rhizogenes NBRC 13257 TaxID=1220581 RepID=A0AA87U527_RHIRH|nr:sarcosine oxidase subunit gamma family protein [Rhizobium rhizogenes]KAA6487586.1 sarcosine oxidase subunit gamma [Agrobacterium sp. ICMP 7243]MCJ9722929.1 sarcosine oxidase subunit gamma [Agrobacterium sp. BETTINA12B]MCJ9758049.1 sarcosine oxidase subunit gamma [Agrobacterium sp. SHOUNA12C]OCI96341.1 sarcosine oxidase subunit gamma [Agrobacterium sp. 13-626]OCJ22843.1 sarcosine oxidase subunit gamma [Agrobacterium sp. B133/95]